MRFLEITMGGLSFQTSVSNSKLSIKIIFEHYIWILKTPFKYTAQLPNIISKPIRASTI